MHKYYNTILADATSESANLSFFYSRIREISKLQDAYRIR
jgi:hypothetical protein